MTEEMAVSMLKDEFDAVPMPELWEKVRAKTEKAIANAEKADPAVVGSGSKGRRSLLYAVWGAAAALVLAAGITAAMRQPYLHFSGGAPEPLTSGIHSGFALSARSEAELEELLSSYTSETSVYEDSTYLYSFDGEGRMQEMLDMSRQPVPVDIQKTVEGIIRQHFPDAQADEYAIVLDKSGEYPVFVAQAQSYEGDSVISEIKMTFYTDEWPQLVSEEELQ